MVTNPFNLLPNPNPTWIPAIPLTNPNFLSYLPLT